MKKIVAILGDYYHSHNQLCAFLTKVLQQSTEKMSLKIRTFDNLGKEIITKPDLIILSAEGRVAPNKTEELTWLTSRLDQEITSYVLQGGSLLALHSGMSCYPKNSNYAQMLHGYFVHHPKETKVTYLDKAGQAYTFQDEHYFTKVEETKTEIVMRSFSEYGESIAAWRPLYGKGKVVCFTPTHTLMGMKNKFNQQTLLKYISWCL